jgi:hypothetical protein
MMEKKSCPIHSIAKAQVSLHLDEENFQIFTTVHQCQRFLGSQHADIFRRKEETQEEKLSFSLEEKEVSSNHYVLNIAAAYVEYVSVSYVGE